MYFDSMASYVDELRELQGELRKKIRDYVNSNLVDASHKEAYGIAILVLVLVVSPIIIILVRNAVATIQVIFTQFSSLQITFCNDNAEIFHWMYSEKLFGTKRKARNN